MLSCATTVATISERGRLALRFQQHHAGRASQLHIETSSGLNAHAEQSQIPRYAPRAPSSTHTAADTGRSKSSNTVKGASRLCVFCSGVSTLVVKTTSCRRLARTTVGFFSVASPTQVRSNHADQGFLLCILMYTHLLPIWMDQSEAAIFQNETSPQTAVTINLLHSPTPTSFRCRLLFSSLPISHSLLSQRTFNNLPPTILLFRTTPSSSPWLPLLMSRLLACR